MRSKRVVATKVGLDVPAVLELRTAEAVARLARFRLIVSRILLEMMPGVIDEPLSAEQIARCVDPDAPDLSADELAMLPAAAVDEVVGEIGGTMWPTMLAGWMRDSGPAVERDLVAALRTHCGLPRLVASIERGGLHDRNLATTLRSARELSVEQLRRLDLEIDSWRPVSLQTFTRKVAHAVLEIATPTAEERAASIAEARCVLVQPESDGSASLLMRGPAPEVVALHSRISAEARRMRRDSDGEIADPRTLAQLRFDLLTDAQIAEQNPDMLPEQAKVQVTVPVLTAIGECDTPGEMLGFGPIDAETARSIAQGVSTWERILTEAGTGDLLPATATYNIPQPLRRHVQLRNRFCTAPGCTRRALQCEVDHVIPFDHDNPEQGGPTSSDNLHPLCTLCRYRHKAHYPDVLVMPMSGCWGWSVRFAGGVLSA